MDIGEKIGILSYLLAFDAPVRGVPVGISAPPLVRANWNGVANRWWKNFEDIFIRFGATHERDRQTDGHRVTAIAALCIALHGKNWKNTKSYPTADKKWLKVTPRPRNVIWIATTDRYDIRLWEYLRNDLIAIRLVKKTQASYVPGKVNRLLKNSAIYEI